MKILAAMVTILFAFNSFASWKSETRSVLKEYKYACDDTQVTVDSIVANDHIRGALVVCQLKPMINSKWFFMLKLISGMCILTLITKVKKKDTVIQI